MEGPTDKEKNLLAEEITAPTNSPDDHFSNAVVVTPLPFDAAAGELEDVHGSLTSNAEYTQQLIDRSEGNDNRGFRTAREVLDNVIRTYLDEIDIASSIPGSEVRIRQLTKKIRNNL